MSSDTHLIQSPHSCPRVKIFTPAPLYRFVGVPLQLIHRPLFSGPKPSFPTRPLKLSPRIRTSVMNVGTLTSSTRSLAPISFFP